MKGWVMLQLPAKVGIAMSLAAVAAASVTCNANVKFGCEGGSCTSSSVGAGGCASSSDADTHGFPADVYAVLKKNCFDCHGDPLMNGAPHTFLHYHDTQCIYYASPACIACKGDRGCLETNMCKTWWSQQILHALPDPAHAGMMGFDDVGRQIPAMPFGKAPIQACEQQILRNWFATCGTDPTVANMCMKGGGTEVGAPCAEDMATASSSTASSSTATSSSSTASSSASGGG